MEFDEFKEQLPDALGDDYYNDGTERQQPTKYFDNVDSFTTLAKRAVNADRTISSHGEALKNATKGYIKIPGEDASVEEMAAYRKAQGVPETAEGYEVPIPEDVPEEDKPVYDNLAKMVAISAHKAGIPPSKINPVFEDVIKTVVARRNAEIKEGQDLLDADIQSLKDTKKEGYDSFISDTNKVAAHFDIKADAVVGIKENLKGSDFMAFLKGMGVNNVPVVREFLGAIAPLVLEGKTSIGGPAPGAKSDGGFSYEYNEHGKPV